MFYHQRCPPPVAPTWRELPTQLGPSRVVPRAKHSFASVSPCFGRRNCDKTAHRAVLSLFPLDPEPLVRDNQRSRWFNRNTGAKRNGRICVRFFLVGVTGFRNHGLRRLCDGPFLYVCANLILAVPSRSGSASFAANEKRKAHPVDTLFSFWSE